jgi:glycosyltransferase involved in cell wall biosynthesis
MSDKKIKVLMVPSDSQGVGHFRNIWPAQALSKHFKGEFEVEINLNPNVENIEYMKQFDIIHFHRHLGPYELMNKIFPELKAAGIKLIMDIDDFWEPPTTHPLYQAVKSEKISEKIIETIRQSDYVTTTTEVFASYIAKYNENVFVIPNALDMNDPMWRSAVKPNETDRCRISWIGGSSHMHDLKLLENSMGLLYRNKDLEDKFQMVMCGFDTRGSITEIGQDASGKEIRNTRAITPQETIWLKFEEIFTNKYSDIKKDEAYMKWLNKIKREDYDGEYQKSYIRRWTLPLTQYGKHYDYCDVCLAPIEGTERYKVLPGGEIVSDQDPRPGTIQTRKHYFNEVKSELKIIEAGMKKKVLIAQDFGIYSKILKNGETGILVNDNKDGWYKAMRKVIQDPEYREMLANNLHEYVMARYELKVVTGLRADFYRDIATKNVSATNLIKAEA